MSDPVAFGSPDHGSPDLGSPDHEAVSPRPDRVEPVLGGGRTLTAAKASSSPSGKARVGASLVLAVVLALAGLASLVALVTTAAPAGATSVINQVVSFNGSVITGTAYAGQLAVTGNTGSVTYVTTVTSAHLGVSGTGVITSPGTTPPGSYTVSGTDSDTSSDSGTWTFTL